ncbi:caspase family protein [Flammeovirga aprica]|uniref:Peptidase C14 caspase domain-containing protein n=1 Tax=Flammeovirga aprica JL-4 TaxID=694437 RepID=A0A7X9NZL4_9BACT|nr:caspase family protein [Flammeovirga aprica]NME66846.1 hypothetical protein [Flammeovirga aprica JL-4]
MKNILLLISFIFIHLNIFAQSEKIVILPKVPKGGTICNAYKVYNNKLMIEGMEEVYQRKKYSIVNSRRLVQDFGNNGGCFKGNEWVKEQLIKQNKLNLFTVSKVTKKNGYKGSYVELEIEVYDASNEKLLVRQKSRSNEKFTKDLKAQVKEAFVIVFDRLMRTAIANYRAKKYIEDPYPFVIPGVVEKKVEVKEDATVEEVVVEEEVMESDVDINIPVSPKVNEDAIAVVIGNQNYRKEGVPEVKYALHDANIIREYLIKKMGFREGNIIYVEDATQADFNALFGVKNNPKGKLFNYVKPEKSDVFIYYSGHGVPDPESQKGYFVPVDTDPSLIQFNGYSLSTFYENIGLVPYRSLQVVLDVSFSGATDDGMLLKNISPVFIKTENKVLNDEQAIILTAATSEQAASRFPEQYHGLFTYYYLKGIQGAADVNNDKNTTLEEISQYLKEKISYQARTLHDRTQTPEIHGQLKFIIEK